MSWRERCIGKGAFVELVCHPSAVMHETTTFLRTFVVTCITLFATVQAQSIRPSQGFQIGNLGEGVDIVIPPSMTQCETFLVYYNLTAPSPYRFIAFYTPDLWGDALLTLEPSQLQAGYIDWICNVPAGHSLVVWYTGRDHSYIVQPGTSSSCLVDLTTKYTILDYGTNFASYTSERPLRYDAPPDFIINVMGTTTSYPTQLLPTISANPDFAVVTTTSVSASSTPVSSSSLPNSTVPVTSRPNSASTLGSSPQTTTGKQINVALPIGIVFGILVTAFVMLLAFLLGRSIGSRRTPYVDVDVDQHKWEPDPDPFILPVRFPVHSEKTRQQPVVHKLTLPVRKKC